MLLLVPGYPKCSQNVIENRKAAQLWSRRFILMRCDGQVNYRHAFRQSASPLLSSPSCAATRLLVIKVLRGEGRIAQGWFPPWSWSQAAHVRAEPRRRAFAAEAESGLTAALRKVCIERRNVCCYLCWSRRSLSAMIHELMVFSDSSLPLIMLTGCITCSNMTSPTAWRWLNSGDSFNFH